MRMAEQSTRALTETKARRTVVPGLNTFRIKRLSKKPIRESPAKKSLVEMSSDISLDPTL